MAAPPPPPPPPNDRYASALDLSDHFMHPENHAQYQRPRQNSHESWATSLFNEFDEHCQNLTAAQWQQRTPANDDPKGYILMVFKNYVTLSRPTTTIGLSTLDAKLLRLMYTEFGRHYPQLNWLACPKKGLAELDRTSPSYNGMSAKLDEILCGAGVDAIQATPMFEVDLVKIVSAFPPTIRGYRDRSFLTAMCRTGVRISSWFLTGPSQCKLEENGCWTIYYVPVKVAGSVQNYRTLTFNLEESNNFGLFYNAKHLVSWEREDNLFCLSTLESFDGMLNWYAHKAAYPWNYFSSHSCRAGFVNSAVAKAIIDGTSENEAMQDVRLNLLWVELAGTEHVYLRPICLDYLRHNRAEFFLREGFEGYQDLTATDLHRDLAALEIYQHQEPHPYWPQVLRCEHIFGGMKGLNDQYDALLLQLWDVVRFPNDPMAAALPPWNHYNRHQWELKIGTRFFRQIGMHPSVFAAFQALTDSEMVVKSARVVVFKSMLCMGLLNLANLQESVVPQDWIDYFALPCVSDQVIPDKPRGTFNVVQSPSKLDAKRHYANRSRKRKVPVLVGADGVVRNLADIDDEELAQIDADRNLLR